MKKMKTLLLTLALGFTFAGAATAVACGDKGAGTPTSSDWFAGQEESLVSLKFKSLKWDIAQYETYALEYSVYGTLEEITFTSSDESIATVDKNGVVTTKGELGTAVITATVEGVTATCEINVVETSYAPVIVTTEDQFFVENGSTLQFEVATEWNQGVIDDAIEYAVSFAENSQAAKASLSVEGNCVSVVSNGVETFDIVISATIRGMYTSKVVTVTVSEPQMKITPASAAFKPVEGKYTLKISSTDEVGDLANSATLDFVVMKGGEVLTDAQITWEMVGKDDGSEDNVKIEGNKLIGQKRGTVTLIGTAEYEGETATVEIACEVIAPVVHLDETITIDVEDLVSDSKIFNLTTPLSGNELVDVTFHGESVYSRMALNDDHTARIKLDAEKFPLDARLLGAQKLVLDTDIISYTVNANVYTMIINDADELDKMKDLSYTGEVEWNHREGYEGWKSSEYYDGYFVLGNDIAYNRVFMSFTDSGKIWACQGSNEEKSRGFRGVFDGQGYNIDGMTVGENPSTSVQSGGMFGSLSTLGVVKNVSFTNATLWANQGFICTYGDGTIENVSISYKKIGGNQETSGINGQTPLYMGSFFARTAGTNARVRNCLIDASAADITVEHGTYNGQVNMPIKLLGSITKVENVVVICPNQEVLAASGADITKLTYLDVMADTAFMKNFDETIWTTVDGIPMFVNQANNLNRDALIEFLNVQNSLVAGFEMLILTNNPYVKIEIEDVAGVTFENSILTATEEAWKKTVTLTATSLLNPSITATHEVYIDSFGEGMVNPATEMPVVYNTNPVLSIGDNAWKDAKNYVYLNENVIGESEGKESDLSIEWQKLGWGESEVTVVAEDAEGARKHFVVTVDVDYVKGDFASKDKVKVNDSAFSTVRSLKDNTGTIEYLFDDIETEEVAPTGYTTVTQLDCDTAWWTALGSTIFYAGNLSDYSDIWFAMKIVNGRWVLLAEQTKAKTLTGVWVHFHFTQTSDGVWALELSTGNEQKSTYLNEYDIKNGPIFRNMMYRDGWGNGFLLYNNGQGEDETTKKLPFTTSIYSTEIYGLKKA